MRVDDVWTDVQLSHSADGRYFARDNAQWAMSWQAGPNRVLYPFQKVTAQELAQQGIHNPLASQHIPLALHMCCSELSSLAPHVLENETLGLLLWPMVPASVSQMFEVHSNLCRGHYVQHDCKGILKESLHIIATWLHMSQRTRSYPICDGACE